MSYYIIKSNTYRAAASGYLSCFRCLIISDTIDVLKVELMVTIINFLA
jgi:hypothetical protein